MGIPHMQLVAVINYANVTLAFVVTVFPTLCNWLLTTCHEIANVRP